MGLYPKYFVLKPRAKNAEDVRARASQEAMMTYAEIIRESDEELAADLLDWMRRETERQCKLNFQ